MENHNHGKMRGTKNSKIFSIRQLIRRIKTDFGANCKTKDYDDFPELKKDTKARCIGCRAKEVIEFLEEYIELIKL